MHTSIPFLNALQGKREIQTPIWLMRQAGRYLPEYKKIRTQAGSFLNLCYNPQQASEVTLQPIRRFGFDASIVFADILVIPDALGQGVDFVQNEGPILDKITTIKELQTLIPENYDAFHKHLNPIYETLSIVKSKLPKETGLIGFAGAPWTVATYMIAGKGKQDLQKLATWCEQNNEFFTTLLSVLSDSTAQYLLHQVKAGAQALQIFDSWAGVLNTEQFQKWSIMPTQKIIAKVRERYPDIPIIGFPRGGDTKIPDYVKQTGCTAVSLDYDIDIKWAKDTIQPLCPVQGTLSPETLLTGKNLERDTLQILETFSGGAHIFNLGHGINKDTPIEHVEKLVKIVKDFRI